MVCKKVGTTKGQSLDSFFFGFAQDNCTITIMGKARWKRFGYKLKASAVATQAGKQVTIGDNIGVCYLISVNVVHRWFHADLNMDGNLNLWCWVQAIMPLCSERHMNLWKGGWIVIGLVQMPDSQIVLNNLLPVLTTLLFVISSSTSYISDFWKE